MILDVLLLLACLVVLGEARKALRHGLALPAPIPELPSVAVIVRGANRSAVPDEAARDVPRAGPSSRVILTDTPAGSTPGARRGHGDGGPATHAGRDRDGDLAVLARAAREAGAVDWLLFTRTGARAAPDLVARALALAAETQTPLVTLFPRPVSPSIVASAVDAAVRQWTGDLPDARALLDPEGKAMAGAEAFLLIQRTAYERIGGHGALEGAHRPGRELVRRAKLAGMPVAATASEELVEDVPGTGWVVDEALERLHDVLPRGRLALLVVGTLVWLVAVWPPLAWLGRIAGAGAGSALLPGLATVALIWHRGIFHRWSGLGLGSLLAFPLGILGLGALLPVAVLQRLLGRGPRFEPEHTRDVPDHSRGVDYTEVYTERYFDGVDSLFTPWGFRDEPRFYGKVLEPVLRHTSSGRALDVGCGYGFLTKRLAEHFETTGIDVSPAAVGRCRDTIPSATFEVHQVEEPFPFADSTFDVVTMTDVIEHIVHPEPLLENASRVLAPGGLLYVTTPNLNTIRRVFYRRADLREHHVSLMSRRDLIALLERHGFRCVESWTYMSAYLIPGRLRGDLGPETGVIARKPG